MLLWSTFCFGDAVYQEHENVNGQITAGTKIRIE